MAKIFNQEPYTAAEITFLIADCNMDINLPLITIILSIDYCSLLFIINMTTLFV